MSLDMLLPRLIRASAGTGKTRDLSSRYIGLLALGEYPDRILATTFTRKAAGEIRERVFSRLARASRSREEAEDLGKSIGKEGFLPRDAQGILARLAEQQHRLLITTLDSLFISIARSFALELGLPADWRIASTRDQAILKEEAVRLLFEENQRAVALEMVRSLHGGLLSRSVHKQVLADVGSLYTLYLFSDPSAWDWVEIPETPSVEVADEFMHRLSALTVPLTKAGEPDKHWQKAIASLQRSIQARDWGKFATIGLVSGFLEGKDTFARREIDKNTQDLIIWARSEAARDTAISLKLQLRALYDMLATYHRCYTATQRRLGILSFDDVKQHLARSALLGDLDHIYYRLDSRIAHLLLDEFQDTSMTEWRVIQPIADEVLSQAGDHSFFCVGDMKQAIYGWRGGVAEIFGTIERRWPLLQPESKQTTYRCSPAVIECVNRLFLGLPALACIERHQRSVDAWCTRFEEHQAARKDLEGGVVLHTLSQDGPSALSTAAALVSELQEQYPLATIGVLVRKNATVSALLEEFSRLENPIEVSEEGGTSLTDSAVVRALLSVFRYLDHPSDSLARFHIDQVSLSHLLHIPESGDQSAIFNWQEAIRARLLRDGYGALIGEWAGKIMSRCRPRDQVRLQQLVDLAYVYDPNRTVCADDFVTHISGEKVELPSEALVRVMTFHKAKGLEFDIVVLPELAGKIEPQRDATLIRRLSPVEPPLRIAPSRNKFERLLIPELQEMYQDAERATVSEALSVLYVGLTRARQGMHLLVPEEERAGTVSLAGIIRATFPTDEKRQLISGVENWRFSARSDEQGNQSPQVLKQAPVEFREKSAVGRRVLTRISPSQRSDTFRMKSPKQLELSKSSRERGILLHKLLEQVEWIENFDLSQVDLPSLLRGLGMSEVSAQESITDFHRLLERSELQELFSGKRFAPTRKLYREQTFALRHEEQIVVGAIDRLVIEYDGDMAIRAELIDFKSDRISSTDDLHRKAEKYREQIIHYCIAARRFAGAEIPIAGKILFLDTLATVQLV